MKLSKFGFSFMCLTCACKCAFFILFAPACVIDDDEDKGSNKLRDQLVKCKAELTESKAKVVELQSQVVTLQEKLKHAKELAILEYKNTQLAQEKDLTSQVQSAYDRGFNKAVETINMFQNFRGGPPPSASFASFLGSS